MPANMPAPMPASPLVRAAYAQHQAGQVHEAEKLCHQALLLDAGEGEALRLLATIGLAQKRFSETVDLLQAGLALHQQRGDGGCEQATLYNQLALAWQGLGQHAAAISCLRQALQQYPQQLALQVTLGQSLMAQGDYAAAAQSYAQVLAVHPTLPECRCALANAYFKAGRFEDAIEEYQKVLQIQPLHGPAHINLARALCRIERYADALAVLQRLDAAFPNHPLVLKQLGFVCTAQGELGVALGYLQRALLLTPEDAETLQYIANIQQKQGNLAEADKNYRRSYALQPFITFAATRTPPDFKVLFLFGPGAGNTPVECLIARATFESHFLNLLPDIAYDITAIRARADVVVNMLADVDLSRELLPAAAALIDNIGKPVINHPGPILATDRAAIAARLQGMAGAVVPETRHYPRATLAAADFAPPFAFPLLLRPAGSHGGDRFEKIDNITALQAMLAEGEDEAYYLTSYVDYRSSDGFFRKYRFIFVDDQVLPYHMAIDDKWKIHHVTTDMANQPWQQAEEKAFLENPQRFFTPQHEAMLDAIRQKIGLDYFGIDCGIDSMGRIVVFEVNACMLVHHHNADYPYKNPAVQRIKAAFYKMLKKKAGQEPEKRG